MRRPTRHGLLLVALVAVPLVAWGCKDKKSTAQPTQPSQPAPPMGGPPGPGGRGGESGAHQIMNRIGNRQNGLDGLLKRALQADQPDWATIQPQAAEYARLAADLGKTEPSKGPKESWATQTTAFADSAAALDKAAQAKDLSAARAAQDRLGGSCNECHRTHRGGRGGFGPPGGRGGPPQGPPPG
ncbi:MAG TPA: cytochrome c [Gemmataceae bacterium]|nr:cytochrome c [Gemmataceae bacterium]